MSESQVETSQSGPVRTLTLSRAQALNSFTSGMLTELLAALEQAAGDQSVRCVVLTGAGRAFCAGQDLSDPAVAPDLTPGAPTKAKDLGILIENYYNPLVKRLRSMPVPVLAAVNGVAAGAGASVALNCDIVIAAQSASFVQAFSKIGLIPDTGATWLLPRLVGRARALGLAMLGDKIKAADAQRLGLIWQCVDDAEFKTQTQALALKLAAMPSKALAATRKILDDAVPMSMEDALDAELVLQRELGFAHDYTEGVKAFVEKRAAVFSDR